MLHKIFTQILPHVSRIRFVFIVLVLLPDAYRFTYHLTPGKNKHCGHLCHLLSRKLPPNPPILHDFDIFIVQCLVIIRKIR